MTLLSGALPQPASSPAATPAATAIQPATAAADNRALSWPLPSRTDLISALLPRSGSPALPLAEHGRRTVGSGRRLGQRGPLQPRIDRSGESLTSRGDQAGERHGLDRRQLHSRGPQLLDPPLRGTAHLAACQPADDDFHAFLIEALRHHARDPAQRIQERVALRGGGEKGGNGRDGDARPGGHPAILATRPGGILARTAARPSVERRAGE